MNTLYLDLETYSETPITYGTHRYAEASEVLLVAYAVDDDLVQVADVSGASEWSAFSPYLQQMVDDAGSVVIQNSAFDRTVLRHRGVVIPHEKIEDTMVLALQHSLPGSLDALCDVLQVPQDKAKLKSGKRLIQLFCKPAPKNRKLRRATRETHPTEWAEFIEYARLDVDAMRHIQSLLPRWNNSASERGLWLLDQDVNDRGIAIDLDLAHAALRAFQRTSRTLAASASALTSGAVPSLTQRGKFMNYLAERHDFAPADMTKGTVTAQLARDDLAPEVRELLEIRQQAAATSPAKYKVLLNATSSDGRLRGTIQFCGASRTGRDAGRLFQPQNLPRPSLSNARIEAGIVAMKEDCEDLVMGNVSELCSSALRGCLVASPGKKLVVADLSNIEGRVVAWLAGEEWKLEAFRAYDKGTGHDLYKITAGRILGKDPGAITKGERQLQGKVPELAGAYGGSVGAYRKMGGPVFDAMSDDAIMLIVKAWRATHPAIVRFWYDLERAVKAAIRNPEETYECQGIRCDMKDGYLRIRKPGGGYLSYKDARLDSDTGQILYSGNNQHTRKWETLETYFGKLVENLTQSVARDIFMRGFKLAEAAGYAVVLRVHDELICEVPDTPEFTAEGLSARMCKAPSWALGLPLAAAGHEMYRYAKLD